MVKHINLDDDIVRKNWQSAEAWLNRSQENICCSHFLVIECGDSREHSHIVCDASLDDSPQVDNEHAKKYCLTALFNDCPFYPRGEDSN